MGIAFNLYEHYSIDAGRQMTGVDDTFFVLRFIRFPLSNGNR
jgi:hypothetical protein